MGLFDAIASGVGSIIGAQGARRQQNSQEGMFRQNLDFQSKEAVKARDFTGQQADINRQFQERLSSSAVSRRMLDMKNAGINPILAAKYDASTPAGSAMAGVSAGGSGIPNIPNVGEAAMEGASTGMQLKRVYEELKNMRAQRNKLNAEAELTRSKIGIAEPWVDVASVIGDLVKTITGEDTKPFSGAKQAYKNHVEAQKIRKSRGIEPTDYVTRMTPKIKQKKRGLPTHKTGRNK